MSKRTKQAFSIEPNTLYLCETVNSILGKRLVQNLRCCGLRAISKTWYFGTNLLSSINKRCQCVGEDKNGKDTKEKNGVESNRRDKEQSIFPISRKDKNESLGSQLEEVEARLGAKAV